MIVKSEYLLRLWIGLKKVREDWHEFRCVMQIGSVDAQAGLAREYSRSKLLPVQN